MPGIKPGMTMTLIAALLLLAVAIPPAYADAAFTAFLQSLWPQAQRSAFAPHVRCRNARA